MAKIMLLIYLAIFLVACSTEEQADVIPSISLKQISKTSMIQGDLNQDSLWLIINFEDGDGDLGFGSLDSKQDLFLTDLRTGNLHDAYKLPDLPPSNGSLQKGTISLLVYTSCCLFPNNIPPCSAPPQFPRDSLRLELYLLDRNFNKSNVLLIEEIMLNCL